MYAVISLWMLDCEVSLVVLRRIVSVQDYYQFTNLITMTKSLTDSHVWCKVFHGMNFRDLCVKSIEESLMSF